MKFNSNLIIKLSIPCFLIPALLVTSGVNAQQTRELEKIVVTATKREQGLQEISVSVSVIDRKTVENAQMDNGTDIARLAPNVNVSYFGLPDQPKYSLRGAATTDFALNTSSATGTIVDEVNLAASYFGGPLLFDIERIEALRGPQGTLFGKNTTGGALHFITRKPSFDTGGYVKASVGDYGYKHVDGAVEAPISKKLAARFAFSYSDSDGFWENENPNGSDLGDIDNRAARLSLLYEDGDFDATLRLITSRSNPKAAGIISTGSGPGNTNVIGVNPRVSQITGKPYDAHQGFWDRSGDIKVKTDGAYLTMNYEMDDLTVTSVTSKITGSFLNLVDADGSMNNLLHIDFYAESEEVQQDIRITSNYDSGFNFIAGLYYFDEQSEIPTTTRLFEEFIRDPSFDPAVDPFAGTPSFVETDFDQRRTSYAAYFNGSFDLSDSLTLNAGIRYTQDEGELQNFTSTGTFLLPANTSLVVPFIVDDAANDQGYSDSAVTGKLGLDLKLDNGSLMYGHYSRGYRSSAFDGSALFSATSLTTAAPETIDTIEFGYKTQFAENRIQVNSAVFFSNYNDLQFLNVISATESELVNEDAEMYGFEVEATMLATDNLQLSMGLGYLQGEYKDAMLNGIDISGNDLVEAPSINFNLSIDYDIAVGSDLVTLHVDTNFVDEQFFDAFNSEDVANDSFWNANGKIMYTPGDGTFQFSIWGKNLTNNDEPVGRIRTGAVNSVFAVTPQPRRFGVEVRYNF
jgi:iron complex outermembrane receptor protein